MLLRKKIYVDKYKVEDKLEFLTGKIQSGSVMEFDDLIAECECKIECVVTFLALLELIKQKVVRVYQASSFGNIIIERWPEDE